MKYHCPFPLLMLVATLSSYTQAKDWVKPMFETTSHDFGTVAKGAKISHRFEFENIYLQDVRVASTRVSCTCIIPTIEKPLLLKTYEKSAIIAELNTKVFEGQREATITVTFDLPSRAEIRLNIKANIRRDVVFNPGSVNFGSAVVQGQTVKKVITVDYAGARNWQIIDVKNELPYVSIDYRQVSRYRGRVKYELTATLTTATLTTATLTTATLTEEAPLGYIRNFVILSTNDRTHSQVPLLVEGHVSSYSSIDVSPSPLLLGVVKPGGTIQKNIVLSSEQPFTIVSAVLSDSRFVLHGSDFTTSKNLHLLTLKFTADDNKGKFDLECRIQTDRESEVVVMAQVMVTK